MRHLNGFAFMPMDNHPKIRQGHELGKAMNWASHVDMKTGRPVVVAQYSTHQGGEEHATGAGPDGKFGTPDDDLICPSVMGAKNQPPVAYSPRAKLVYIPGNHTCMSYEPFQVGPKQAGRGVYGVCLAG